MKKKLYIGSNLKMYKNIYNTISYLKQLQNLTFDLNRLEYTIFIIPSFTSLHQASKDIDQDLIWLGAQNMCWAEQGQFTGEISPLMLQELGMKIVELGHSERRHVFGEDNQLLQKKVTASLEHGFTTLLCIGENEQEKEFNISNEILRIQLKTGLADIKEEQLSKLWIAYEPVWAIGVNGKPATAEYAQKKHSEIRTVLKEMFGNKGKEIPILYGGSVNLQNAEFLITQPDIDGLFVGRSAWNAEEFNRLIRTAINSYQKSYT